MRLQSRTVVYRDQVRGKSAQEMESKLVSWRRCAAASQTGDMEQIKKACLTDMTSQ